MQRLKTDVSHALGSIKTSTLRPTVIRVVDLTTDDQPAVGDAGILAAAVVIAQQLGRDIHEDIQAVERCLRAAEAEPFNEDIRAMRDMVNGEMKGRLQ